MREVHREILRTGQKFAPRARVLLCTLNGNSAFRQIPLDPFRASVFDYFVDDLTVIGIRFQFGWRSSVVFYGMFSAALGYSHTHTVFSSMFVSKQGRLPPGSVRMVTPRNRVAVPPSPGCAILGDLGEWV